MQPLSTPQLSFKPFPEEGLRLEEFVRDGKFTMQSSLEFTGFCFITKNGEYRAQITGMEEYSCHQDKKGQHEFLS